MCMCYQTVYNMHICTLITLYILYIVSYRGRFVVLFVAVLLHLQLLC